MKISLYFIFLLSCSPYLLAQKVNLDVLYDLERLSGTQVNDIEQDKTGFLWIGTAEGLYRYDGYNLKLYETHDKFIGASNIQVLYLDKKDHLWIGTKGGLLKYEKKMDRIISFRHDPGIPTSINSNSINCITEDHEGHIWIGLSKSGLDLFLEDEKIFHHYLRSNNTGLYSDDISDIHLDPHHNLWVSTFDSGIYKLDLKVSRNLTPSTAAFKKYKMPIELGSEIVPLLFEDPYSHHLYGAVEDYGLLKYDESADKFIPLKIEGISNKSLYDVTYFSENHIWVSTSDGIMVLDPEVGILGTCSEPICNINRPVFTVFNDKQNISWIATDNGLKKNSERKIKHYKLDDTESSSASNNIIALCKQGSYLWLGTWGRGLYLKDEKNGKMMRINPNNDMLTNIWDMKLIGHNFLLVATTKGLVRLHLNGMSFKENFPEKIYPSKHDVTAISKNKSGDTWIGGWESELYKMEEQTGIISKYTKFATKDYYVMSLCVDSDNRLWIGTANAGLICLTDPEGNVTSMNFSEQGSVNKITSDFVSVVFEDNKKRLWIGTADLGINILDLKTWKLNWMVKGNYNLPVNTIRAITQDSMGFVWISSKSGLSKYDTANNMFINYTEDDGLEYMEFNPKAVERDGATLYFGNQRGYNTFRPEDLEPRYVSPRVFITDFRISNKSIAPGERYEGDIVLPAPLIEISDLELHHKAKNIAFEFSTLDFLNPKQEIYAYKLDGVDDDWKYTNAFNRVAAYTNLAPGDYTFKVKVVRTDEIANASPALHIRIIAPLWQRNWFKIIVGILVVAFIYVLHLIRLMQLKRQKMIFERLAQERVEVIEVKNRQLEKQNAEIQSQAVKLHEADQSKLTFFSNISHEFRTPLMLIIGPITTLLKHKVVKETQTLLMIHRNAQRLLRLMDQIMDISKIEAGSLALELTEGDIIQYIRDIASSFDYLAHTNKVKFEFKSPVNACHCYFDHDKTEKIIYNLLSNAFKVTPESGSITIGITVTGIMQDAPSRLLQIEISDSGSGIPKDELPNLFTRFYRTGSYAEGTGMGLSLTKNLVELHKGTITVRSCERKGTCFTVKIPIDKSIYPAECIKNNRLTSSPLILSANNASVTEQYSSYERSANRDAKTILILDDNDDMRNFILQLLIPSHHVLQASGGQAAIKLACEHQPDLIISDMIMPGMDGYQFLRAIKSNPDVSHIPVILLTAKSNVESRLLGLEEGADDYLTKPFDERILLARVKYLIEKRQIAKDRFATDINIAPREITITSMDEEFIQNLLDLTERNISNPDFGSDLICQEMGVSRSHLYTKVKALTDLSVNEFIRIIRLKRAAVLLTRGQQHVNEVAYNVGFNDRSYFSKCFVKQFGISPAQYQKRVTTAE